MLGLRRLASSAAAPAARGYATTTPSAAKLGVEAMASKVDPIPKPVVEKLSKEALADK